MKFGHREYPFNVIKSFRSYYGSRSSNALLWNGRGLYGKRQLLDTTRVQLKCFYATLNNLELANPVTTLISNTRYNLLVFGMLIFHIRLVFSSNPRPHSPALSRLLNLKYKTVMKTQKAMLLFFFTWTWLSNFTKCYVVSSHGRMYSQRSKKWMKYWSDLMR